MTVLDESIRPSLSAAMREGSMAEHRAAEGSAFMSELLAGRVDEQGYGDYLLHLRTVYAAMEETVRANAEDPIVAAVADTALERLAAIDADLDHWIPDGPRTVDSPAAAAYRERVLGAGAWGGLLAAHHYTRYLGDLSGGQAVGRILDRAYELDGRGIAFYDFPGIEKPKAYKDGYRARLDALGLDETGTDRVVDEVKVAFRLNQAVLAELAQNLEGDER